MRFSYLLLILSLINSLAGVSLGDGECGPGRPLCAKGFCCSKSGYCGTTDAYCAKSNCKSQCPTVPSAPPPPPPPITPPTPPSGGDHLTSLISRSRFEEIFKHRGDPPNCKGNFYTYNAFIEASKSFNKFAAVGNTETRKREVAAFLAQTSHETTGGPGWAAPDGPYAWGYCFIKELSPPSIYCDSSERWPCAPGKTYIGRGPMQLSWNFNYGQAGEALKLNLLNNPDWVTEDPVISFKTAFWFWMTPQSPKPSCHEVVTGQWTPSAADISAGRKSGYGVITNIINGGNECNKGENDAGKDRIGFYKKYCKIFGVDPGPYLDCYHQRDFNLGLKYVASY